MTEFDSLEGAGTVRDEDAFDVAAVADWLAGEGVTLGEPVLVRQFGGGASNLTYSLRTPTQDLILRRPPAGTKAKGAHDMTREFRVQRALAEPFGSVPEMVALCLDESVLGSEFYVMRRIDGLIPRKNLGFDLAEDDVRRLCTNALDTLIALHDVDPSANPELAGLGKGPGYVRRQVEGWSARMRAAMTKDAPDVEPVMAWIAEHQPEDVGVGVIHNDFRLDNLVLDRADPTQVIGVLDWEMATVGDPLMDLSCTLAYWVQADDDTIFQRFRRQPTNLPGMLTRDELVDYYTAARGLTISDEDRVFYEVFGLFRLAVISQQIHYRFFHGQTSNKSHAIFGPAVHYLDARCQVLIG